MKKYIKPQAKLRIIEANLPLALSVVNEEGSGIQRTKRYFGEADESNFYEVLGE